MRNMRNSSWITTLAGSFSTVTLLLVAQTSAAGVGVDTSALNEAVTVEGVRAHQAVFQQIADDNGGTRDASSDGYFESVRYVSQAMTLAGYAVNVQVFPFTYFEDTTPPVLEQVSPVSVSYLPDDPVGFATATYSGRGDVETVAQPVDVIIPAAAEPNTSTSGCEPEDFADFTAGNIALVQRGSCSFFVKAANAEAAGASGVIIFNEGQEGRMEAIRATLGQPGITIPVVGASYDIGQTLASTESTVILRVDSLTEVRVSANVLADTPIGKPEKTVVVGAHLDSVTEGPGIQDNGSGSAAILEIALQMSEIGMLDDVDTGVRNRVRFAWWGAEELGLLGSEYYVATLPDDDLEDIVANLNFDMIGSPNYVRFVYDGDGSETPEAGPEGSAFIEWLYRDYFMDAGLSSAPTAFSGRSDYRAFIINGIPAGGLFTGAEGIKTEEEAAEYGGTAGEAYDPCYHLACDDFDNISLQGLDEMTDAAAYSINVLAVNDLPSPEPTAAGRIRSSAVSAEGSMVMDYIGRRLMR